MIVFACWSSVSCDNFREAVIRVAGTEKQCRGDEAFMQIKHESFSNSRQEYRKHSFDLPFDIGISWIACFVQPYPASSCVYVLYSADTAELASWASEGESETTKWFYICGGRFDSLLGAQVN